MKNMTVLSLFVFFISCGDQKETATAKEKPASFRATVKCESLDVKEIDPKTGKINVVRIWRCDSNYAGNKSLMRW